MAIITDEDLVILISNCVRRLTNAMLHTAAASDDGIADSDGMHPISSSFDVHRLHLHLHLHAINELMNRRMNKSPPRMQ